MPPVDGFPAEHAAVSSLLAFRSPAEFRALVLTDRVRNLVVTGEPSVKPCHLFALQPGRLLLLFYAATRGYGSNREAVRAQFIRRDQRPPGRILRSLPDRLRRIRRVNVVEPASVVLAVPVHHTVSTHHHSPYRIDVS